MTEELQRIIYRHIQDELERRIRPDELERMARLEALPAYVQAEIDEWNRVGISDRERVMRLYYGAPPVVVVVRK